jgi:hypothetical protein
LRWFFLLIRIIAIHALIAINITGSEVKPPKFSRGPSSPAGSGVGIAFVTFIFEIPTAPWHPEMQFMIRAIVVYQDVGVSANVLRSLNRHCGAQIVFSVCWI